MCWGLRLGLPFLVGLGDGRFQDQVIGKRGCDPDVKEPERYGISIGFLHLPILCGLLSSHPGKSSR